MWYLLLVSIPSQPPASEVCQTLLTRRQQLEILHRTAARTPPQLFAQIICLIRLCPIFWPVTAWSIVLTMLSRKCGLGPHFPLAKTLRFSLRYVIFLHLKFIFNSREGNEPKVCKLSNQEENYTDKQIMPPFIAASCEKWWTDGRNMETSIWSKRANSGCLNFSPGEAQHTRNKWKKELACESSSHACDHRSRRERKKEKKNLKTFVYLFKQQVFTECPLCASWDYSTEQKRLSPCSWGACIWVGRWGNRRLEIKAYYFKGD